MFYKYSIHQLFLDIKKTISKIKGELVNYRRLSVDFLKMRSKWYINDLLLRSKRDPDFFISTRTLNLYEKSLRSILGQNFNKIKLFLEKYSMLYSGQYNKVDPNFIDNYFQIIKTLQQAYWFGWLLAEGSIRFHRKKYFLAVEVEIDDGILIKRFTKSVGISPKNILYNRRPPNEFNEKYHKTFILNVSGKLFA